MKFEGEEEEKAELSMSPLIDCVFLLLIFFLVATMLKVDPREVEEIELPKSDSALEVKPDEEQFVINLDEDGVIYVEGEESTVSLLHERLREISIETPDKHIRLDTDQETPFYRVVEVLDLLQFRELTNVGLRTYHERYDD
jgi:biopolymer transport protein ExbD